jgi:prevent-host-death family protein
MSARKGQRALKASRSDARTSTVTSAIAQNGLGEIMGRVATGERVFITRYGRPQVVMLSVEEYEELVGVEGVDLESLESDFDELVEQMQRPGQRTAVAALFEMSGQELGEASTDAGDEGA